jgi:phosphoserine phosphatase
MTRIIVHTANLSQAQQQLIENRLAVKLHQQATHYRGEAAVKPSFETLQALRSDTGLDINVLPEAFDASQIKLVISDMDSTLIAIECIDEIADFAGIKPQISEITEAAMRGELNFEQSLTQRVGLLKGLDESALQKVYDERLTLNPGAEALLAHLKHTGIKFALVSGGFTFFTERLQKRLAFDYARANVLATENGQLKGSVVGGIIGAEAKQHFLKELCAENGITPAQTIALGDGANDLKMMGIAGLSVAYHAKPKVQTQTHTQLNTRGLDAVLDFLSV